MTTPTELDFEAYKKDLASLAELRDEIDRLEGFEELTASQERRLKALRSTVTVLDEQRKSHERACLAASSTRAQATTVSRFDTPATLQKPISTRSFENAKTAATVLVTTEVWILRQPSVSGRQLPTKASRRIKQTSETANRPDSPSPS